MIRNVTVAACLLVLAIGCVANANTKLTQGEELPAPIEVQMEAARPSLGDRSSIIVVTLRNRIASAQIKDMVVQVGSPTGFLNKKTVNVLEAGQTWADTFAVPAHESNLYLLVNYNWNNQSHSLARAITRPELPKIDSLWPILVPVGSSLIGAFIGAWLVNLFTGKRERARAKFEWSKMLFEKYEKSYRDFLRNWGGSSSAAVLETQFDALKSGSLIAPIIEKTYDETFRVLSDTTASNAKKEQACNLLGQTVRRFMQEPWYGSTN